MLDNGDFAFPLQVLVGLEESFLNQRLTLVVSVSPAEKQLSLDDILSAGVSFMEKSPPVRFIGKQVYVYDPLNVTFKVKRLQQRHFISASLENTHADPVAISAVQLHLLSVNNVKSAFTELPKFYNAEMTLPPQLSFPFILREKEKYEFIISTDSFPIAPVDTIDLEALKPALLIDWAYAAFMSFPPEPHPHPPYSQSHYFK